MLFVKSFASSEVALNLEVTLEEVEALQVDVLDGVALQLFDLVDGTAMVELQSKGVLAIRRGEVHLPTLENVVNCLEDDAQDLLV